MKILFCTDGSEASNFAIKSTLTFLNKDTEIHILNAIDWGILPTFVTFPYETEVGFPDEKNLAEQNLEIASEYIKKQGFKVTKKDYINGHADKVILNFINENDYDLVVLGSHGKKGISKWLGSVSRKVASKSHIPVLIGRPPKKEKYDVKTKEILIAADGSAHSYHALEKLTQLFNLKSASIEIINVIPGVENLPVEISMDKDWLEICMERQETLAKEIFQKSKDILEKNKLKLKNTIIKEGDAALKILEYLEDNPKMLTVMGTHSREGVSNILLGSVSKRVLDNAPNLLLIVPLIK